MNRVTMVKDDVPKVLRAIQGLVRKQVLIGIPASSTGRDESGITNSLIGYISEFGSPARNIPARPWLIPGTTRVLEQVTPIMRKGADAALAGNARQTDAYLEAAGQMAEDSAKNEIATGNFVPLAPATIRARKYARQTQSRRQSETHYLQLVAAGMPASGAQAATGLRPLVNTGQFLKSVTHVVRNR